MEADRLIKSDECVNETLAQTEQHITADVEAIRNVWANQTLELQQCCLQVVRT